MGALSVKRAPLPTYLRRHITGWAALYVAGTYEAVYWKPGQNAGTRPIKTGVTTAWTDTISGPLDSASPFVWTGVLFRLWCQSIGHAKNLDSLVAGHLKEHSDPLRKSWADLGPELDVDKLQRAIRKLGRDYNIRTYTDAELVKWAEAQEAKEKKRVKDLRRAWA